MQNKPIILLFDKYVDEKVNTTGLRPATIRGYDAVFKFFIELTPDVRTVSDVSSDDIHKFIYQIRNRTRYTGKGVPVKGVKNNTVATYGSKLNAFFNWAVENEHLLVSPMEKVILPKESYEDEKAIPHEDIQKLYAGASIYSQNALTQLRDRAIITTLRCTGIRRGELVGLRVSDIDLVNQLLTVRAETSKSKKMRKISINSELKPHLLDYLLERKKRGYKTEMFFVASNRDGGLTKDGYKHWVKRLIKKSGVKFHLHQFRHRFACDLLECGVHLVKIQRLMGHTDIRMTLKYMRSSKSEDYANELELLTFANRV